MTARLIRIDDEYTQKFNEFVDASNGHIEIIDDPKLTEDKFYYQRRKKLHQLHDDIQSGKVAMIDEERFEQEMDLFEKKLISQYDN